MTSIRVDTDACTAASLPLKPRSRRADVLRVRRVLPETVLALVACLGLLAVGGLSPAFTDFESEAEPALRALLAGDLGGFLSRLPAYGGSVVLRAPFAVLGDVLGGDLAVFRAMALPC